jgi:hypothetical protein
MKQVRFQTVIDQDRIIRPPSGIDLPKGLVEVTVRTANSETTTNGDPVAATRKWMLAFAEEAEKVAPNLPSDLAEHHDHYAHGKPLP